MNHAPAHEEIARRAREIYEQSGRVPGRDVQNWLQAEAELMAAAPAAAENAKTTAPKTNTRTVKAPNPRTYA